MRHSQGRPALGNAGLTCLLVIHRTYGYCSPSHPDNSAVTRFSVILFPCKCLQTPVSLPILLIEKVRLRERQQHPQGHWEKTTASWGNNEERGPKDHLSVKPSTLRMRPPRSPWGYVTQPRLYNWKAKRQPRTRIRDRKCNSVYLTSTTAQDRRTRGERGKASRVTGWPGPEVPDVRVV